MSKLNKLAHSIRERDNPEKIGVQIGRVLETDPYKIEIGDGKICAKGKNLKLAAHLIAGYARDVAILSDPPIAGTETLTKSILEVGDYVIVAASENNQVFYVLDKVVNG